MVHLTVIIVHEQSPKGHYWITQYIGTDTYLHGFRKEPPTPDPMYIKVGYFLYLRALFS